MSQSEAISATPLPQLAPPIRLWPGVVIATLLAIVLIVPAVLEPGSLTHMYATMFGPLLGFLLFMIWWLFFTRISWSSRLLAVGAFAAGIVLIAFVRHPSFHPMGAVIVAMPTVLCVWALWLLLTPLLEWPVRLAGLMLAIVAAWGAFGLLRFEGTSGGFVPQFSWRFSDDGEGNINRAQAKIETPAAAPTGDWPGFRGPDRDGVLRGVRIAADWEQNPPKPLWQGRIGKGWGSFTVIGKNIYTQEQRGPKEAVVCLDADTGAQRWLHLDDVRFNESIGGPGPRATPTYHEGKLYTQGATGLLNCLDAGTGDVLWSRDIVKDSEATAKPEWGYAASPLVVDGTVIAVASKTSVLGYDAATGAPRWQAPEPTHSYSSPHLATLGGVRQVLLTTEQGAASFDPKTGARLWSHDWPMTKNMSRCTQPQVVSDKEFLLGTGFGMGLRRVRVAREADKWTTSEVWTSRAINPYFNDGVLYEAHFYGFDGTYFVCVDAETGKGKWRARGYGNGQVLLLADQGVLLILAEDGAVALVEAQPAAHKELGRIAAIEGKTWNHPVVAHGRLFVRNGSQAACYELSAK